MNKINKNNIFYPFLLKSFLQYLVEKSLYYSVYKIARNYLNKSD